jgi:hypothetical protein
MPSPCALPTISPLLGRLQSDVKSRSQGTLHTLRHQCSCVGRTRFSLHSATRPQPPSGNSTTTTTVFSIRYSVPAVATPATYTRETVTYAQAIPLQVGGSDALATRDSEREREEDKDKGRENAPQHIPPPWFEAGACMRLFRTRRSETRIGIRDTVNTRCR